MSYDTHPETNAASAGDRHIGLRTQWSERTINFVAVCTGVLVVALIAVLMGMA
jgi:hypothetical protein